MVITSLWYKPEVITKTQAVGNGRSMSEGGMIYGSKEITIRRKMSLIDYRWSEVKHVSVSSKIDRPPSCDRDVHDKLMVRKFSDGPEVSCSPAVP